MLIRKVHFFRVVFLLCISLSVYFIGPELSHASATNGTIDSLQKYAWGEKIGWVNFGTTGGTVHVTDSAVTGYAWSQNLGWINLSPTQSGVSNNGEGALAGFAWGENTGYISFSGVSINSSGRFTGSATSSITGVISFDCSNCAVQTDWRPVSVRNSSSSSNSSSTPASGGGGGGGNAGGPPAVSYYPPAPPSGGFQVVINGGTSVATSSQVSLSYVVGPDVTAVSVSNSPDFSAAPQFPYHSPMLWDLCATSASCPETLHTVYVKFYNQWGRSSDVVSAGVVYQSAVRPTGPSLIPDQNPPSKPPVSASLGQQLGVLIGRVPEFIRSLLPSTAIRPPQFISRLPEFINSLAPNLFGRKSTGIAAPTITVPSVAQAPFTGLWVLLPQKPIREFALSPMPKEFVVLTNKFEGLQSTFDKIGIAKQADVTKLRNTQLSIPNLSQAVGLAPVNVKANAVALPAGIPLAQLSPAVKAKLPSEVVFARSLGEKLDIPMNLRVDERGLPETRLNAIAGTPLHLVVKPEHPARRVHGSLVFKSRTKTNQEVGYSVPLNSFLSSLFSAAPRLSSPALSSRYVSLEGGSLASISNVYTDRLLAAKPNIETRLTLMEFDYSGPDESGIYTADVEAPIVEGNYEVITRIDYQKTELASKEIHVVAVIDPEGYVFEKQGDKELRIPGAVASIFWLNPATKKYELWPGPDFNQENPQVTGAAGTYAFLVPPGYYYLAVEAPGYDKYEGKPFAVQEGTAGIHVNIELSNQYWYLHIIDWKTALLIIVALMLLYNFYKDRRRDRALALPVPPPTAK